MKSILPAGPKGFEIFRIIQLAAISPIAFFDEIHRKYGNISFFEVLRKRFLFLFDPEDIQRVLQTNHSNYTKSIFYKELKPLLGIGLLTNEGNFWKNQRKLIQPTFHREKMLHYVDIMREESEEMVQEVRTNLSKSQTQEIDVSKQFMASTLQIVARAVFDVDAKNQVGMIGAKLEVYLHAAIERIRSPFSAPLWLPSRSTWRVKKSAQAIHDWIVGIIQEKKLNPGKDLVSMLWEVRDEETQEGMSLNQIRDEAVTMILAGHETTSNALTWALYLLAQNPPEFQKFEEELEKLKSLELRPDTISQFTYARMIIDETLRLFPPAWVVERKSIKEDTLGGYKIRPNTNISISVYKLHHDPRFWSDPEIFLPERFAPNRTPPKPFTYFPFGGGPRICIGNAFAIWEAVILLVSFCRNFRVEPGSREMKIDPSITLRPKSGLFLKVISKN